MIILDNAVTIITVATTVLSVIIAYLTEHHDGSSKQLELIKATVQQQLDLKDGQYQDLKRKYEEKINSLDKEIQSLKQENRRLKAKINQFINKERN